MRLRKVFTRFFLIFALMLFMFNSLSSRTWAKAALPVHNVDTGLDYVTIQEAVSANETLDGHTIRVDAGTYYEQVVINKSLSLIGQDKSNTIVDAGGNESAILVTANNVTVSGFTAQNATAGFGAIELYNSRGDNITDNIMKDTYYGIYIYSSSDSIIMQNEALSNTYSGAYLYLSQGNTVSDCNITNNVNFGIFLYNSSTNLIFNNLISGQKTGISLTASDRNTVHDNSVSKAELGIQVSNTDSDLLHDNNVSACNQGIDISNSNNIIIINNTASSNNINGINLASSDNNTLSNNTAQNNKQAGICLSVSSNNTLSHNNVTVNNQGIQLANSNNCTVNENNVAQNNYSISLSESTQNTFWYNDFQQNQYALQFENSTNNTLVDNNFVNNTQQLTSTNSTNHFDNGVEGNFWDTYNGTDADHDATGDTPYTPAENNVDNHPLMGSFFSSVITLQEDYRITFICNSTVSEVQYNNVPQVMQFNVTGPDSTAGLCRIQVPNILISPPQVVLVDGQNVNATTLPLSNATYGSLYFTYTLSTHQVTIMSKSYYDLLEEYNALLNKYQDLNSTYQKLVQDYNTLTATYNSLGANYSQLQNSYNTLNTTYQQLTGNYQTLQDNYNILSTQYGSLNSTYNNLQTSFNELKQEQDATLNEINNTRNLLYALTAILIVAAAILLSMNLRFRQKISRQERIIQSYNPLDIARILFMSDVEKRGAKIEEFEKKHGVKIRPRDSLEEVLKSLEKKDE
jgi:parallel beta-helix repeat protein